jgi:hypothetical protein
MENKDINEDDFYLKRVCQFYFDFVKQQKLKFEKRYQEKNLSWWYCVLSILSFLDDLTKKWVK